LDRLGPGDAEPNGVFTRVLIEQIHQPGVPVDRMLEHVRDEVVPLAKNAGRDQVPALYDQTIGEFCFKPGAAAAEPERGASAPLPAADPPPARVAAAPRRAELGQRAAVVV
jgi:hypothetical protein